MHTNDTPLKRARYTSPSAASVHLLPAGQLLQASIDLGPDDNESLENMNVHNGFGNWDEEN